MNRKERIEWIENTIKKINESKKFTCYAGILRIQYKHDGVATLPHALRFDINDTIYSIVGFPTIEDVFYYIKGMATALQLD